MARVLRLPDHGRLLVCTDLQGCMRDFERMVVLFEQALQAHAGDAHLMFTGDLIHGPHIEPEDWPDFLGEYYRDQSGEVMIAYAGLAAQYPGRVHALLGNHEHGHIGGPHTAKCAADEVALLEHILGPSGTARMRGIIHTFALAAVSKCGAVFTHGAPAAVIQSIADLEAADLSGSQYASPLDVLDTPSARSTARCASTATTSSRRASRWSATSRSWCRRASECSIPTRSTSASISRRSTAASTISGSGKRSCRSTRTRRLPGWAGRPERLELALARGPISPYTYALP
jgi:hypothetical protein